MVSYAKARAEGLGLECKTGLLARPERVVILAIGLLIGAAIWAVLLLAVFSNITAIERIAHIWQATRQPEHVEARIQPAASPSDKQEIAEVETPFMESAVESIQSVNTSEGIDPSIEPVRTSVPPFNRGVQQE